MNKKTEFTTDFDKIDIPSSLTSDTLSNIFKEAGRQPNAIPVEILELKAHKQNRSFRIITILAIIAFVVLVATAVPVLVRSFGGTSGAVVSVDTDKPSYAGSHLDGINCVISLKAGKNPISWSEIYAKTVSGKIVSAVSVDESAGTVTFPLDQGNLNIYIPDTQGNTLQLLLTAQG